MKNKTIFIIFIVAFALLYLASAAISFIHSIGFFAIGNTAWMSTVLGLTFELGQAIVLTYLLVTKGKNGFLPWVLMFILTTVQIIGNVFSVYKYMSMSNAQYFVYLQNSLLFWIQGINQMQAQVILSWIMGALLPIIALAMTGMIVNALKSFESSSEDNSVLLETSNEETIEEPQKENYNIESTEVNAEIPEKIKPLTTLKE